MLKELKGKTDEKQPKKNVEQIPKVKEKNDEMKKTEEPNKTGPEGCQLSVFRWFLGYFFINIF